VLDKPVVSKNQRAERNKQDDIKFQSYILTRGKNYMNSNNFKDVAIWQAIKQAEGNWQDYRGLWVVNIYKIWVYKAINRTYYYIEKFNMVLNLCRILEVALFFQKYLRNSCKRINSY